MAQILVFSSVNQVKNNQTNFTENSTRHVDIEGWSVRRWNYGLTDLILVDWLGLF